MAIAPRSIVDKSITPPADVGAAAFANSTVTSAFVANFLTDFLIADASNDAVKSIFLLPDPTSVVIWDFLSDFKAVKLSPSKLE